MRTRSTILRSLAIVFALLNLVALSQGWRAGHPLELALPQHSLDKAVLGEHISRKIPLPLPFPAQTYEIPGFHGLKLKVRVAEGSPGAPAVILLHGYSEDSSQMAARAAEIKKHADISVVLPDFHAHGSSEGGATSMGYHEAEDLAAVAAWTRERFRPRRLVLYGLSMGGAAASRAVARLGTRADGLILECVYDSFFHAVRWRAKKAGWALVPLAPLATFWIGAMGGYNAFAVRPEAWARDIHVPCLVLASDADDTLSLNEARQVMEHLAGPRRMVVFPGADHAKLYQSSPDLWRASVFEFLDQEFLEGSDLKFLELPFA